MGGRGRKRGGEKGEGKGGKGGGGGVMAWGMDAPDDGKCRPVKIHWRAATVVQVLQDLF